MVCYGFVFLLLYVFTGSMDETITGCQVEIVMLKRKYWCVTKYQKLLLFMEILTFENFLGMSMYI